MDFLLSNAWILAFFAFCIGIFGGIFIHKSTFSDSNEKEKLKSEKQALQEELDEYKSSVANHFEQTSALLTNLTDNYVKVYQHLAEGSQKLTNAEQPMLQAKFAEQQLGASIKQIENNDATSEEIEMEVPRDYAPKPTDEDAEGTLSEAFSIKTNAKQEIVEEGVVEEAEDRRSA